MMLELIAKVLRESAAIFLPIIKNITTHVDINPLFSPSHLDKNYQNNLFLR
jgi:predicted ATPase